MTEEENKKNIQILLDDYLQLERMEENTFEWNLDILEEKYNVEITNMKPHIYTTNEVWDLYRNDKDFFYTSFSDFTKSNGFVFIKAPEKEAMEHEVTRLQNIGIAMANDIEDKRNKIMLLKKAIIRIVAEFETDTPVVPNQKKALEYANGLLLKMMNE